MSRLPAVPMLIASLLCWLGAGLWMLASDDVARRVLGWVPPLAAKWVFGVAGGAVFIVAARSLVSAFGGALAVAGGVLVVSSALSAAVVAAPLVPRLFAASLPIAALGVAALALLG